MALITSVLRVNQTGHCVALVALSATTYALLADSGVNQATPRGEVARFCAGDLCGMRASALKAAAAGEGCGPPTTAWTILQHDGPHHLGLRCNAFSEHQLALITSGCVTTRPLLHQMALITSGSVPSSRWLSGVGIASGLTLGPAVGPPTTQISRRDYIHPGVHLLTEHV